MKSAGLEGFEPSANRLRADCSNLAELQAPKKESIRSNIRHYLGLTITYESSLKCWKCCVESEFNHKKNLLFYHPIALVRTHMRYHERRRFSLLRRNGADFFYVN